METYIISSGHYMCADYREKRYTSKYWLNRKLKSLNYPYKEIYSGADWNNYSKHYKLIIL